MQFKDTVIMAHIVDSEHKRAYTYLLPTPEKPCLYNHSD